MGLVRGLYALCPYIAGEWPQDRYPSSVENNGILLDLHNNRGRIGYGIEAFEAGDPLAWPGVYANFDGAMMQRLKDALDISDHLRS